MTILNKVSNKSLMTGVTPIADVPDAPTIGTATDVGTSRAYNNGSATVAYTAAPTGGTATTFTATSTPGGFTATGASPITVTGLQSATSYTFAVSAANSSGTLTSSSSSAITATTVPQAPTIGTFTDGGTGTTGTLTFTAGATGGKSITNYKYSTDSSTYTAFSPAQTTSPLSLTGLTPGTYNFSVKAVNANGDSTASSTTSGTVVTPSSFYNIATLTPTSGTSVTFSSIPSTYKSLQIRGTIAISGARGTPIYFTLNGDTTVNYFSHALVGFNSSVVAANDGGNSNGWFAVPYDGVANTSYPVSFIADIVDYSSGSKYSTTRIFSGANDNTTGANPSVALHSTLWKSTSVINSITILAGASNTFASGTSIALYGVN